MQWKNAATLTEATCKMGGLSKGKIKPNTPNPLVVPSTFSALKAQRVVNSDSGHLLWIGLCGSLASEISRTLGTTEAMTVFDAMIGNAMEQSGMARASLEELGLFKDKPSSKLGASKGVTSYKLLLFVVLCGGYVGFDTRLLFMGRCLLQMIGLMMKKGISARERLEVRHRFERTE